MNVRTDTILLPPGLHTVYILIDNLPPSKCTRNNRMPPIRSGSRTKPSEISNISKVAIPEEKLSNGSK